MLAMSAKPAFINVCGGAAHSTMMSVSGALLLISVLPRNSISKVSMYMVFILLLQSACDLSGTLLPLKGERVSSSVFTTQSVFAFPFIHANQFFHSNVPCVILGFIMLIMLNANFGWITCWSTITSTLRSFGTVHSVFAFPFITAIQFKHLNVICIIFVLFMMIKHMSAGWHVKHIIPFACLVLAGPY